MVSADKTSIHSIKVLGEGAFGIVDLVVVETPKAPLLCVRKKLLKQVGRVSDGQSFIMLQILTG